MSSGLTLSLNAISALWERMRTDQQQMQNAIIALESRLTNVEAKLPGNATGLFEEDAVGSKKARGQDSQPPPAKQDLEVVIGRGSEPCPVQANKIESGMEIRQGPDEVLAPQVQEHAFLSSVSHLSPLSWKQLVGPPSVYAVEESMWELVLFVGLRDVMNTRDTLLMGLCFCATVAMQFFVCVILREDAFLEDPFPEEFLSDLQAWRLTDAHSDRFANPVYTASLSSRVCNDDRALTLSTFQQNLHLTIEDYTNSKGELLALVAIVVWTSCCVAVLRKCIISFCALLNVQKASVTKIVWSGHEWRMETIRHCRAFLGVLVFLARFLIAGFLFPAGCKWLAYTESIEELLLNASALGFVLEIDEIIYAAFVPLRWAETLRNFKPLDLSANDILGHWAPQLLFIISIVMISVAYVFWLRPFVEVMEIAQRILCTGEKDFIYGVDAFSRISWIRTFAPGVPSPHINAQRQIVDGLIHSDFDFTEQVSTEKWTPRRFNLDLKLSQEEFAQRLPTCGDTLGTNLGIKLWSITGDDRFHNASLASCKDLMEAFPKLCESNGIGDETTIGNYMRFQCPVSCGCTNVSSGLFFLGTEYFGCPLTTCSSQVQMSITNQSRHLKCKDRAASQLRSDPHWQRFARILQDALYALYEAEAFRQNSQEDFQKAFQEALTKVTSSGLKPGDTRFTRFTETRLQPVVVLMNTAGCSFLKLVHSAVGEEASELLCHSYIHGASFFCPDTCRCKQGNIGKVPARARCPASCFVSG